MSYRFTHKNKWQDDWFLSLSVDGKVLFDYMTDNCDNAGFFEMSMRLMCFMIGMDEGRVNTALKEIEKCYIKSPSGKYFWLKTFLKHQKNLPLNPVNNAHRQIIKFIVLKLDEFNYCPEIYKLLPDFDYKHKSFNFLPEQIRGLEGAKNNLHFKKDEGASEGLNEELNNNEGVKGALEGLKNEGVLSPTGKGKGSSNGNNSSLTTTIINNAKDDFKKKSSSLPENENPSGEDSKKNKNNDAEFAEAVEETDGKTEKEKKVAPKKEKEFSDNHDGKLLHNKLKTIFLEYYKGSKKIDYYWNGKDGRSLNELIKKLKFHLKPLYEANGHSDKEIDDQHVETAFNAILKGLSDKFTIDNLSVSMLNSRLQENLVKIKEKITGDFEVIEKIKKDRYDF